MFNREIEWNRLCNENNWPEKANSKRGKHIKSLMKKLNSLNEYYEIRLKIYTLIEISEDKQINSETEKRINFFNFGNLSVNDAYLEARKQLQIHNF
jgi:hypothetical protein